MLAFALLGVSLLFGLLWLARAGGQHRANLARNAGALALAAAGLVALMRGRFAFAAALFAGAGLFWLLVEARRARPATAPPQQQPAGLSDAEARAILGVSAQASRAEIQAAYRERMRRAHPDQGGDAVLASRLNAARDRLLKA